MRPRQRQRLERLEGRILALCASIDERDETIADVAGELAFAAERIDRALAELACITACVTHCTCRSCRARKILRGET